MVTQNQALDVGTEGAVHPHFRLSRQLFLAILMLALGVGLMLRINYIQGHFLWTDETTTRFYMGLAWSDFLTWFREGRDFHPPLFFAWLKTILSTSFGLASMQTLRYVNLIWLPATIGVMGWYGLQNPRHRCALATSALLVATGPTFVYLGAELRSYGLFILLAVALLLLTVHYLDQNEISNSGVAILALTVLLMTMTHYTGLLVAGSIIGAAVVIAIFARGPWNRFVLAGLIALAGFATHLPALLNQLERRASIYKTPVSEASGFVLRGLGPIGFTVILLALMAIVIALTKRFSSQAPYQASTQWIRQPVFWLPTLSVTFFGLSVIAAWALADVDLLNFGISLVPALFITLAAGTVSFFWYPRTALVLVALAAVWSTALSVETNRDPSVFEGNRVSTMDVLSEAIAVDRTIGQDFGQGITVIHVDWRWPNEYFQEQSVLLLPAAYVEPLTIQDRDKLDSLILRASDESGGRILIITRLPIDTRIIPEIPDGFRTRVINKNLVEVLREP